jgi:CSLREA domain-containing protein
MAVLALRGRPALGLVGAMVLGAAPFAAQPAVAALPPVSIVVNSLADAAADDGTCTLREAIEVATTNTASGVTGGECPARGPAVVITFDVAGAIALATALPPIKGGVTIDGADEIVIDGPSATPFSVEAGGALTLRRVKLQNSSDTVIANGAHVLLDRVTVTGTTGAGLNFTDTVATVQRSTISGYAYAGRSGGGIVLVSGDLTVANSTITGNSDGGIAAIGGILTLSNDTITGNYVFGSPGGELWVDSQASATVVNTIITGDPASPYPAVHGSPVILHSLVIVPADGLLGVFGLHGGSTPTYQLLPTATSAIGQGDAAVCASGPVGGVDQRGVARGSACDIGAVELDTEAPTLTVPVASSRVGGRQSGSTLPLRISWTAADAAGGAAGSGVQHSEIWVSAGGAAYTLLSSAVAGLTYDVTATAGKVYRWRVRAVDFDGNVGPWVASVATTPALVQQSASAVAYASGWHAAIDSGASGGSVKYATARGASVSYRFTSRGIAIVLTKGPSRGEVQVFFDGHYQRTVDLYASRVAYQVVAWQKTWATAGAHTIKLVVPGTSGRPRADLDAFTLIK